MKDSRLPPVLAISVGNTRVKIAVFSGHEPDEAVFVAKDDLAGAVEAAARLYESIGAEPDASVVVASVNAPVSDALVGMLRDQLATDIYRVPEDMPVPIGTCLAAGATPGVDRLLNAAAAFARVKQACIVVDAGTCITVDFIDGEGVFHGGAIAPGVRMQLAAMHEHTAALPKIDFAVPEGTAWGADTREAMLRGVYHGARGLAWRLIEKYAEEYGGFPPVLATGGDAEALFADDELLHQVVPDLVLRGIALAARSALSPEADVAAGGGRGARVAGDGFSLLPREAGTLGGGPKTTRLGTGNAGGFPHGHGHDHTCGPECDHE